MYFNEYVWHLYTESEQGRRVISEYSVGLEDFCRTLVGANLQTESTQDGQTATGEEAFEVLLTKALHRVCLGSSIKNVDEAVDAYRQMVLSGVFVPEVPDGVSRFGVHEWEWYENIDVVSWGLYLACPEYFLPYMFFPSYGQNGETAFYALEEICAEFGIALPSLPVKRDKLGKALYYGSLVRAFYEFRKLHGLSPEEMCAFLYDFGVRATASAPSEELPEPAKVWLLKGGRADFEFLDQATGATVAYSWGANPDIRRGDILLMYMLSPRSCIHSVWRARSDAYIDPFFHYHDAVAISSMVKTQPVTFREMKQDPVLGLNGLVRRNLQGASGDPFSVDEYDAILRIMETKGQDTASLPRLEPLRLPDSEGIQHERDVERSLVEPFLVALGYSETDWIRQMSIRMGRGERNYPDYAFGANTVWGEESALMILEAKYRVSTRRELREAFYQAKSYALRLQAKSIVVCALDGIWTFSYGRTGFDLEDFVHKTWYDLEDCDVLYEISQIIGRNAVFGAVADV